MPGIRAELIATGHPGLASAVRRLSLFFFAGIAGMALVTNG
jgi:hypothetical protein